MIFVFKEKKCSRTSEHVESELDDVNKASCGEDAWILAGGKVVSIFFLGAFVFPLFPSSFLSPVVFCLAFLVLQGLLWLFPARLWSAGKGMDTAVVWCLAYCPWADLQHQLDLPGERKVEPAEGSNEHSSPVEVIRMELFCSQLTAVQTIQ